MSERCKPRDCYLSNSVSPQAKRLRSWLRLFGLQGLSCGIVGHIVDVLILRIKPCFRVSIMFYIRIFQDFSFAALTCLFLLLHLLAHYVVLFFCSHNDYVFCCVLEGAPSDGSGFRTRLLLCVCSPCALPKCAFKEGKVPAVELFELSAVMALV